MEEEERVVLVEQSISVYPSKPGNYYVEVLGCCSETYMVKAGKMLPTKGNLLVLRKMPPDQYGFRWMILDDV